MNPEKRYLTVPQACARLNRTERSLWGYVKDGRIKRRWEKDRRRAVFLVADVDRLRTELEADRDCCST